MRRNRVENTRTQQQQTEEDHCLCLINFGPLQNDLLPFFSLSFSPPALPVSFMFHRSYTRRYSKKTSRVQLHRYLPGPYPRVPTSLMSNMLGKCWKTWLKALIFLVKFVQKLFDFVRKRLQGCRKTVRKVYVNCLKAIKKSFQIIFERCLRSQKSN